MHPVPGGGNEQTFKMENIENKFGFDGCVDSRIGGRSENQDTYGFTDTPLGLLVVVCDGMGGGPAGKTASELAVNTILNVVRTCKPQEKPENVLRKAVEAANSALMGAVTANPSLQGMGTTCVVLLLNRKAAYIVHVGDSRCYQLREGKIAFRTADHSYVAEMVRKGELTEEQARQSSNSNVITRAVGIRPTVEADIDKVSVKPGDRFALMTDGIWGVLPEMHLVGSLCSDEELPLVVSELADRIDAMGHNNGGRHDNMTLAIVDCPSTKKHGSIQTPATLKETGSHDFTMAENTSDRRKASWTLLSVTALLALSLCANAYLALTSGGSDDVAPVMNSVEDSRQNLLDSLRNELDMLKEENQNLRQELSDDNSPGINGAVSEYINNEEHNSSGSASGGEVRREKQRKDHLDSACDLLHQLEMMGKKGGKEENTLDIRKRKRQQAASCIRQAASCCTREEDKKRLDKIAKDVGRNNEIVSVDGMNLPTKDAIDAIRKFVKRIDEIKKDN